MYGEDAGRVESASPWAVRVYSLAMELLLCRLRDHRSGLSLPGSSNLDRPPTPTQLMRTMLMFLQRDVQYLQVTLSLCEKASSEWVNWANNELSTSPLSR